MQILIYVFELSLCFYFLLQVNYTRSDNWWLGHTFDARMLTGNSIYDYVRTAANPHRLYRASKCCGFAEIVYDPVRFNVVYVVMRAIFAPYSMLFGICLFLLPFFLTHFEFRIFRYFVYINDVQTLECSTLSHTDIVTRYKSYIRWARWQRAWCFDTIAHAVPCKDTTAISFQWPSISMNVKYCKQINWSSNFELLFVGRTFE